MQLIVTAGPDGLDSHWVARTGWRSGRAKYALHLTMERADEVQRIARSARPVLEPEPGLDPVPQEWLHLTMTGIGFTDEVSPDQLARVLDPVTDAWRRLATPLLQPEALLLARESVRVTFSSSTWLDDFVAVQRAAVDEVLGAHDWAPFRPHVSLAYANGAPVDVAALRDRLGQLADDLGAPGPTPASLTALELRREQPLWHWTVLPTG